MIELFVLMLMVEFNGFGLVHTLTMKKLLPSPSFQKIRFAHR